MSIVGDPSAFAECFPDGLIGEILEMMLSSWDAMPKPPRHTIETQINRRYGVFVRREKSRRNLPFRVHIEHSLTDPVTFTESGRIDLCLQPGSHREELYFAFECKRLRIRYAGSLNANTTAYVGTAGMGSFVSGQYSVGLPHGGMIGYVMDGQLAAAKSAVKNHIQTDAVTLQLIGGTDLVASRHIAGESRIAESSHQLAARVLVLHHLFLPL